MADAFLNGSALCDLSITRKIREEVPPGPGSECVREWIEVSFSNERGETATVHLHRGSAHELINRLLEAREKCR